MKRLLILLILPLPVACEGPQPQALAGGRGGSAIWGPSMENYLASRLTAE